MPNRSILIGWIPREIKIGFDSLCPIGVVVSQDADIVKKHIPRTVEHNVSSA